MTDLQPDELEQAHAAVAAHGLASGHRLPDEPLSDADHHRLITASGEHRTLGLLGEAVRDDVLPVTDDQLVTLEECMAGQHAHGLRIERLLLDAARVLDDASIDCRVLKGVALAHTAYPGPEWRVFADADLLVPSGSLGAAVTALVAGLDARREVPELRRGFDDRFGKEVLLRARGALELDVHRTFVEGALGLTIDLDDLFAPGDVFTLAGTPLRMLPPPQLLLHAAYATVLGEQPPRLMSMRDVAQIVHVYEPDAGEVVAMAHRWRAEAVLARALTTTWDTLALSDRPPLVAWSRSYDTGRIDQMLLDSHVSPNRAHTRHLAALLMLPGVRDRAAYLQALVWPDRRYLAARGFTRRSFAGRALRSLR